MSDTNEGRQVDPGLLAALEDLRDLREGLNDPAREVIAKAWRHFEERGKWPSYLDVERAVVRALPPASDIWRALRATPKWVGWLGDAGHPSPMTVKLLAIAVCIGSESAHVLHNFWRVFTLARSIYVSTPDDQKPQLRSSVLIESAPNGLGMSHLEVRQAFALLESESLLWGGSTTDNETAYEWQFEIANHIYDYRDVETLADYIRLRKEQDLSAVGIAPAPVSSSSLSKMSPQNPPRPDPRKVFVIHGRDEEARRAVCDFLRDLDLHPLPWEELVAATGSASPYTGEVIARAFNEAQAVVVILTPDDEARLHPDLHGEHEEDYERQYSGQARPNVLFEAGMALMAQPDRTLLIEIGRLRPVSDLSGRNTVRLGASAAPLLAIKQRLTAAGCAVQDTNAAWMEIGRFTKLAARTRQPVTASTERNDLPRGKRLAAAAKPAEPILAARLLDRGQHDYLLEVSNRGGVTLRNVTWELPVDASNWDFANQVLPSYPYDELPPREYVRVPALVTFGGPVVVDVTLSGDTPGGSKYQTRARLSVYG